MIQIISEHKKIQTRKTNLIYKGELFGFPLKLSLNLFL